uniref:Uncharacterized protein n=1 Tax=Arundo donax TaxID=35708 RepID=A0A0A9GN42_ARUDO
MTGNSNCKLSITSKLKGCQWQKQHPNVLHLIYQLKTYRLVSLPYTLNGSNTPYDLVKI